MPNPIQLNQTTTPLAPHLFDLLAILAGENLTLTLVDHHTRSKG